MIVRINDNSDNFIIHGEREEHIIKFSKLSTETVSGLIRLIWENIEWVNEVINLINLSIMRLYSKDGVEITDNDVYFIHPNDVVYLDLIGQEFNFAQVLDQYTKVAQLGLTGKVFKLKEIAAEKHTVIKMISFEETGINDSKIEEFLRNLSPLKLLEHRNVAK